MSTTFRVICIVALLYICLDILYFMVRRKFSCSVRHIMNWHHRWRSSPMSSKLSTTFPVPATLYHTDGEVCRTVQDPFINSSTLSGSTAHSSNRAGLSPEISHPIGPNKKNPHKATSEDRINLLHEDEDNDFPWRYPWLVAAGCNLCSLWSFLCATDFL